MGKFNRDNKSNGGKKFGGRNSGERSFGGRNERGDSRGGFDNRKEKMTMFKTTCSDCGNACEVPFKPTGDKPVFCSDCFRSKGGNSNPSQNKFGGRNFGKSNFGEKKMYSAVCSGCGNKCEVPFQPTNGKPVYCSNCFEKSDNGVNKNTDQFQKQFDLLNTKLDKILKNLSPEISKEVVEIKKLTKKVETPKIKKSIKKVSKKK